MTNRITLAFDYIIRARIDEYNSFTSKGYGCYTFNSYRCSWREAIKQQLEYELPKDVKDTAYDINTILSKIHRIDEDFPDDKDAFHFIYEEKEILPKSKTACVEVFKGVPRFTVGVSGNTMIGSSEGIGKD
jgi:hypothetical protein